MAISQKPVVVVVAGPNGAGKTSLTEKLLLHKWMSGCDYINPDLIARDEFGNWDSAEAVLKAAQKAHMMREKALEFRKNLAFETVLSAPDKIDFLRRAKDAGYFLRFFFISTEHPSINAARVAQRVMEGGHSVPISKIISRYAKSITNAAVVAMFADRAYVYDNSVNNHDPKLLFRTRRGNIAKCYCTTPPWAQILVSALKRRTREDEAANDLSR